MAQACSTNDQSLFQPSNLQLSMDSPIQQAAHAILKALKVYLRKVTTHILH